jgi:hypothetical protein
MNEFLTSIFGEGRVLGRSILVAGGLVALTFVIAQSLVALLSAMVPDQSQRFSANSVPQGTRLYTVTRSVLDDQISTGSVNALKPVPVDPCRK